MVVKDFAEPTWFLIVNADVYLCDLSIIHLTVYGKGILCVRKERLVAGDGKPQCTVHLYLQ